MIYNDLNKGINYIGCPTVAMLPHVSTTEALKPFQAPIAPVPSMIAVRQWAIQQANMGGHQMGGKPADAVLRDAQRYLDFVTNGGTP